jgi:hypothetical protein
MVSPDRRRRSASRSRRRTPIKIAFDRLGAAFLNQGSGRLVTEGGQELVMTLLSAAALVGFPKEEAYELTIMLPGTSVPNRNVILVATRRILHPLLGVALGGFTQSSCRSNNGGVDGSSSVSPVKLRAGAFLDSEVNDCINGSSPLAVAR